MVKGLKKIYIQEEKINLYFNFNINLFLLVNIMTMTISKHNIIEYNIKIMKIREFDK